MGSRGCEVSPRTGSQLVPSLRAQMAPGTAGAPGVGADAQHKWVSALSPAPATGISQGTLKSIDASVPPSRF